MMIDPCEPCRLQDCEMTDDQLAAGWHRLLIDERTRVKLASDVFSAFDSAEARASTDPAIRKVVTGRAIARCLQEHLLEEGICAFSELTKYAQIDDPTLPIHV